MNQSYYGIHQDLMKMVIMTGQEMCPELRLFPAVNGLFYTKNGDPVKVGTNGLPDLFGFIGKYALFVEIKSGKSRIKKKSDQGKFRDMCKKLDVFHIEATSIDQFKGELDAILESIK